MYKTYYTYGGFITKAENRAEALTKIKNSSTFVSSSLKIIDIYELTKTEVVNISNDF